MHAVIERARKKAKISGLANNYPDDKQQRGKIYWDAFVGALSSELRQLDERQFLVESQTRELYLERARLERKIANAANAYLVAMSEV